MKSIVVFCGSGSGNSRLYEDAAIQTGTTLAQNGIKLVYGGARIGLMGAVADAAMCAGGTVLGIIPGFLSTKEIAHSGITELVTVDNMHERKLMMHEMSDGVIALPGGWGTMEELFEMLTWAQLGLHQKPIGLLNTAGYYDTLIALCDHMVAEGFLQQTHRGMLLAADNVHALLELMQEYKGNEATKWITESGT
jgi:uncharacterized protein (TIGR00730 family)